MRIHKTSRLAAGAILLLLALGGTVTAQNGQPVAAEHPSGYFTKAAEAHGAGRHDDATFWLYVAQLRYRAYLQAHPGLDPSGEPALFASLMETVGRPINEYAWGDVAKTVADIDRALRWDEENPDLSVAEDIRRRTRAGLVAFRDDMSRRTDEIRRERSVNGLTNR